MASRTRRSKLNSRPIMPNVVFDASSVVGALLKQDTAPERALLLARWTDTICLSSAVENEIREVLGRPKFERYLTPGRIDRILDLLMAASLIIEPVETVTDCRDAKDNKYLELALAAGAEIIVTSGNDLLVLNPWRGIHVITPAEYISRYGRGDHPNGAP